MHMAVKDHYDDAAAPVAQSPPTAGGINEIYLWCFIAR